LIKARSRAVPGLGVDTAHVRFRDIPGRSRRLGVNCLIAGECNVETHWRTKLKAHFIIALLGLAAISPAATSAQQSPANREATAPPRPQAIPDSKVQMTFALERVSDGILCPKDDLNCADQNIWWKDFTLLASNGHTLHLTSIPFPNIERAEKHFQGLINNAEKILRREPESGSKGEPIGEKTLGLFPAMKGRNPLLSVPQYRLFWTRGKNYLELEGEHLEDVLALESRLKEEGVKAVWTWH